MDDSETNNNEKDSTAPPLTGLRVLDLATVIAGPYSAGILGEFGAEVIKVEQPKVGCSLRRFGTPTSVGDTVTWLSEARNKKSLTLDLRTGEGSGILKRLATEADILIENFRPGTMERWGLGWDVLHELNPRLLMLRVTGYGQTGPYKDRPGFARVAHGVGGLAYLSGMPKGVPVTPGSTTLGDYLTGLYGAIGLLMALRYREETGKGQYVDASLYESVFRCTDELAPAYGMYGVVRERHGPNNNEFACPNGHFPHPRRQMGGDQLRDRQVVQAPGRRHGAGRSLPPIMSTDTRKPGLSTTHDVNEIVRDWAGSLTREEVLERCFATGAPAGPLNTIADIFGDRQFHARRTLVASRR